MGIRNQIVAIRSLTEIDGMPGSPFRQRPNTYDLPLVIEDLSPATSIDDDTTTFISCGDRPWLKQFPNPSAGSAQKAHIGEGLPKATIGTGDKYKREARGNPETR